MRNILLRPLAIVGVVAAVLYAATFAPASRRGGMELENGVYVYHTPQRSVRVLPVSNEIFYISSGDLPADSRDSLPTAAVEQSDETDVTQLADEEAYYIMTPSTTVRIDRESGRVSFLTPDRKLLLSEAEGLRNSGSERTLSLLAGKGESYYGAGERGHSFRLNGDSLPMWNRPTYGYGAGDERINQMNITSPYLASDRGYSVLVDDFAEATLVAGDTLLYTSKSDAPIGYWFINGQGSLAGATDGLTKLTGRQPLPPFWSLGYISSRYGYHDRAELYNAVDSLRRADYPLDAVVLDLYWYGVETDMGRLDWDSKKWPDPEQMLADLRQKSIKTILISQPYINKIGAIDRYNEVDSLGLLTRDAYGNTNDVETWVGAAGMFDVSNPDTRSWLWNRYKELTDQGVEGWWGDLGEPEQHPLTIVHDNGLAANQYHNVYGNEWSRIISEGFANDYPDRRLMLMMRGGTAGLQRHSVFPWSGDVSRSWVGLQAQIPIMLNSALSGLGYMSSDIGGFAVDEKNPIDPELYVRWMQLGVFSPTLRTHAQLKPEPYNYPQYQHVLNDLVRMRYRWLPYNYTLAYENATTGAPFVRPLNFAGDNPEERYADIEDEYLWGSEILVASVLTKGARSRKVLFPAGEWYDWDNPSLHYKGGTTATVKAPVDRLPLFARAGSFVPQYEGKIDNTEQYDPTFLTVRYFPSAKETSYTLFDDDRKSTTSLTDGEYQLTTFTGSLTDGSLTISLSTDNNGYEGMPAMRMLTIVVESVVRAPKNVELSDGTPMPRSESLKAIRQSGWHYDAANRRLELRFPYTYSDVTLTAR